MRAGTRLPFLVMTYAKANHVDHERITLASVVRFIEDNWLNGERIGGGSFDATAGKIDGLFDFASGGTIRALYLNRSWAPGCCRARRRPPRIEVGHPRNREWLIGAGC